MKPIPPDAKIGVVIGTYGASTYVHIGAIACNRHEYVPVLIHDDGSDQLDRLQEVVDDLNLGLTPITHASLCTPGRRIGKPGQSMLGDMSAFAMGLEWASVNDIDILVKFSRRWIVNRPWVNGLQELVHNTQYTTYSATDMMCGLGFRTECCALHVPSWIESGGYNKLRAQIATGVQPVQGLVGGAEGWYHEVARHVHRWAHPDSNDRSDLCAYSEGHFPKAVTCDGYGFWPMMGLSRAQKLPGILWHHSCGVSEYAALSKEFGLSYTEADFELSGEAQ